MTIPVAVTAKNEAACIEACLHSLRLAIDYARAQGAPGFELIVVLDDCEDATQSIVEALPGVRLMQSSGGIVNAQRTVIQAVKADYVVFADADIVVAPQVLWHLCRAMQADPDLRVAYPLKRPLAPERDTLLARALYAYNAHDGFQTRRRYFNGKLFAIRGWHIPTVHELSGALARLPEDRFYNYQSGIRTDDIYLSRSILMRYGVGAIRELDGACIYYRPARTYKGMYRTYRRMRMEIERLDAIVPETRAVHRREGVRGYDGSRVRAAPLKTVFHWYVFRLVLQLCKLHYRAERIWYRHVSRRLCPQWEVVEESKRPPL